MSITRPCGWHCILFSPTPLSEFYSEKSEYQRVILNLRWPALPCPAGSLPQNRVVPICSLSSLYHSPKQKQPQCLNAIHLTLPIALLWAKCPLRSSLPSLALCLRGFPKVEVKSTSLHLFPHPPFTKDSQVASFSFKFLRFFVSFLLQSLMVLRNGMLINRSSTGVFISWRRGSHPQYIIFSGAEG